MVQLNVINGSRTRRHAHSMNACCTECASSMNKHSHGLRVMNSWFSTNISDPIGAAANSVGDWVNTAWNVSLNLGTLFSDMYNFHLEMFDDIQYQWTHDKLIKTNFSASWIPQVAAGITKFSHMAGIVIISVYVPWLAPILTIGGQLVGMAMRSHDVRYKAMLQKLQDMKTTGLDPKGSRDLMLLIYWMSTHIGLIDGNNIQGNDAVIIHSGLTKGRYSLSRFFKQLKDNAYANQLYDDQKYPEVYQNINFKDNAIMVFNLYNNMVAGFNANDIFPDAFGSRIWKLKRAYSLLVGDQSIEEIHQEIIDKYNSDPKLKLLIDKYSQVTGKKLNLGFVNPYAGYVDPSVNISPPVPNPQLPASVIDPVTGLPSVPSAAGSPQVTTLAVNYTPTNPYGFQSPVTPTAGSITPSSTVIPQAPNTLVPMNPYGGNSVGYAGTNPPAPIVIGAGSQQPISQQVQKKNNVAPVVAGAVGVKLLFLLKTII